MSEGQSAGDGRDVRPRVFLSYAREDRKRVATIAAALSSAGYRIWWDDEIAAGVAFAHDIQRELDAADAVVVVWSAASVDSNWVLDEAGRGRDRGCLVPVVLDGTPSPLGFGQFHSINFARWNGRADAPPAVALKRAVARAVGERAVVPTPAIARPRPNANRRLALWLAVAFAVAAALFGGWRAFAPRPAAARPTIAVLPFADMSAEGHDRFFAEGISEEILDTLARDPRLKVIGRTTAWAFRDHAGDPGLMRGKLGVTRLLEGSVRGGAAHLKVSVHLIDTADGSELWGQSFDRQGGDVIQIQEQVARAVAARLGAGMDAPPPPTPPRHSPSPQVYENVIVARQLIHTRQAPDLTRARSLLDEAIQADPEYAPAHAARSFATSMLSSQNYGDLAPVDAIREARREAERAIALDPKLSEAYDALGEVQLEDGDSAGAIGSLSRAIALNPENADARIHLGGAYGFSGDLNREIAEFERAEASDPLWSTAAFNLVVDYGQTDHPERAREVAARFRALSPDPAAADAIESSASIATGDLAGAFRLADRALARNPGLELARQARQDALTAMFATDRLNLQDMPGGGALARAFAEGRFDEVVRTLLAAGSASWDDLAQAQQLTRALAAAGRPADLARAFDARYPSLSRFVGEAQAYPYVPIAVAWAFDRVGRARDAQALRANARARLLRYQRGGYSASSLAVDWAALLTAEGDRAGALSRLERAQWWHVCSGPLWLGTEQLLAPLRTEPRFQAVLATCRAKLNEQRRLAGMGPARLG